MNTKLIISFFGKLLFIEAIFMVLTSVICLIYGENDFIAFIYSILITCGFGGALTIIGRKSSSDFSKREGFFIVTFSWILISLFGTLPFVISGSIPSFTDAFFETMSGFTTTGASILNNIEELPHGILFWRSIIQWIGGMGIVVFTIALMPLFGIAGVQLFTAEVPGLTLDKIHPRIRGTAIRLWSLYFAYTIIETILLWAGGMTLFDAICHSFTTMATGGYSTKQASVAFYDSPFIQYVIIVFMFLAGTNFTLSYFGYKLKFRKIIQNEEFRYYVLFTFIATALLTIGLILFHDTAVEKAFRDSLFQVVSIVTTTGYVTADYLQWLSPLMVIIFILMFVGGSSGSTGGGVKVIRIVTLLKNSILEFKRIIHPKGVVLVRMNNKSIPDKLTHNILAFVILYVLIFLFGTLVMSFVGHGAHTTMDLDSAMGSVAATLGNIGPGIGSVGPVENFAHISAFGKWFLSFLMLVGRLELFTVLILLSPAFWRK